MIDAFEYPNKPNTAPKYRATYDQAVDLCAADGKRLCSAQEWEKACKGPKNHVYSYGDTYDQDFCGEGMEFLYPSGAKGFCRTGWGAYDMSGNFSEWTASPASGSSRRIVKGGMRDNPEKGTRCAFQTDQAEGYSDGYLSFRCCRNLNAAPVPVPAPPPAEDEEGEGEGEDKAE
jgi:formylglycine-generating enzyme required for sulfatase activity